MTLCNQRFSRTVRCTKVQRYQSVKKTVTVTTINSQNNDNSDLNSQPLRRSNFSEGDVTITDNGQRAREIVPWACMSWADERKQRADDLEMDKYCEYLHNDGDNDAMWCRGTSWSAQSLRYAF